MYYRVMRAACLLFILSCFSVTGLRAQAPANDSLCNAIMLTVGDACTTASNGDLTGSGLETNEPLGSCVGTFPAVNTSVWFTFVAPPSGLILASASFPTLTTLPDAAITIYSMNGNVCSMDSLVEVACNAGEGSGAQGDLLPSLPATLTPGDTFYIQFNGISFAPGLDQGPFCLQIEEVQPPVNDNVCNAIDVVLDAAPLEFSTIGATGTGEFAFAPPPNFSDFLGVESWGFNTFITQSVWFKFTAPASGIVAIDITDPTPIGSFNSKMALYQSNDCTDPSAFTLIEAQDNTIVITDQVAGSGYLSMQPRWLNVKCLTPGDTYYLLVDGATSFISPVNPTNSSGRGWLTVATVTPDPLALTDLIFDASCAGDTNGGIFAYGTGGAGLPLSDISAPEYSYSWSTGDSTIFLQSAAPGAYDLTVTDACDTSFTQTFIIAGSDGPTVAASGDAQICPGESVALGSMIAAGNPIESPQFYLSAGSSFLVAGTIVSAPLDKGNEATLFTADTLPNFTGLTYAANLLWGLSSADELYTIEPGTGVYTLIDTLVGAHGAADIRDIDYNFATDRLEAYDQNSKRYSVDLGTAVTTFIDSMQIPPTDFLGGLFGMAIDTNGVYYFTTTGLGGGNSSVLRYDDVNAQMDTLAVLPFGSNFVTDLAIDPLDNSLLIYHSIGEFGLPATPMAEIVRWSPLDTSLTRVTYVEEQVFMYNGFAVAPPTLEPYMYSWSPVDGLDDPTSANPMATVTETTEYIVSITDACGTTTDTVTIIVDAPSLALVSTPDNGTDNGTATVTGAGGVAPYTYLWSNGDTTEVVAGLATGIYTVTITDALGCTATDSVEVASNVSIDDLTAAGIDRWTLYPNPAQDRVEVVASLSGAQAIKLTIFSSIGQVVETRQLNGRMQVAEQIQLEGLQPGVYMVGFTTSSGTAWQRLVVR